MKKNIILILLIPASITADHVSRSYFSIHQHHGVGMPAHISGSRDRVNAKRDGRGISCDITVLGGATTNKNEFAKYFSIFGRTSLRVKEMSQLPQNVDVVARNFNLRTNGNFESTISFAPKQKYAGFSINYQQNISKKWWFEINAPFMYVSNDMCLKEEIKVDGGPADTGNGFDGKANRVATMTDAFKQVGMLYGKIDGKQTKKRFGDIDVRVGYNTIDRENCYLKTYGGIVIPAGNKPEAVYMFEPVVGNGKHFGISLGSECGIRLCSNKNRSIYVECMAHSQYLFENSQKRSFDLVDKSWGRYLALYKNSTTSATGEFTWGINQLTQDAKVSPRLSKSYNIALVYTRSCGLQLEGGYNFYTSQAEKIKLKESWSSRPFLGDLNGGANQSASARAINANYDADGVSGGVLQLIALTESDLNLDSAAHPAYQTHIPYVSIAKHLDNQSYPKVYVLGCSYELSANNAAAKRLSIWGKFGLSF